MGLIYAKRGKRAGAQELLVSLVERVPGVALDIDEANHLTGGVRDGDNQFRAGGTERREPTRVFMYISDIDDGTKRHRRAAKPLGYREAGKGRRRVASAGDHGDVRRRDLVNPDPTIGPLRGNGLREALGCGGAVGGLVD
jgi:hypothetical protein